MSPLIALSIIMVCLLVSSATADRKQPRFSPNDKTWTALSDNQKLAVRSEVAEVIGAAIDKGIELGVDSYGNKYYLIYDHLENKAVVAMVTEGGEMHPLRSPTINKLEGHKEDTETHKEIESADNAENAENPYKGTENTESPENVGNRQPLTYQPVEFDWYVGECSKQTRRAKRQSQISWSLNQGGEGYGVYGRYGRGRTYLTLDNSPRFGTGGSNPSPSGRPRSIYVNAGASYNTRYGSFGVYGNYGGSFGAGSSFNSNYGVGLSYTFRF